MVHVCGHHDQVMLQGCGSDKDVGITDALALYALALWVEHGIDLRRLDKDVIRQWQHLAVLAALFEVSHLAGRTTRLQSSSHLIACDDRAGIGAEDGQGTACVVLHLRLNPVHDG